MILTDEILESANKFVMDNDRLLYKPYFECAEQFCSDNSVLIGGKVGILMLIGGSITRDDFVWDLYCDNVFQVSKDLSIALSGVQSHVPSDTVAVQTNIKNKELTIYVQARMLFRLFAMDKYRGIKLIEVMNPPVKIGYFTGTDIKCISADVHLIDIYRILYSPAMLSLWESNIAIEEKLFSLAAGETESSQISDLENDEIIGGLSGNEYNEIILQNLSLNYVLIGDYAIKYLGGKVPPGRLQIIASDNIDDINKAIERIIRNKKVTLINIKYSLNLLNDFQLTKFTIYISDGKRQSALIDVFNSTQYELIPYIIESRENKKVAIPWVILRFLFIDNWILSLVRKLELRNGSDIANIDNKISSNLEIAKWVRKIATFNTEHLEGIFSSEAVAKKKLIKDLMSKTYQLPMFYPAKVGGFTRFKTRPINFTDNKDTKARIIKKITKIDVDDKALIDILREYDANFADLNSQNLQWGINKSTDSVSLGNKQLFSHIKKNIKTYLDIGCGSGFDAFTIENSYKPKHVIYSDIIDHRQQSVIDKTKGEFILIEPGKPIPLSDASVDLVSMFHVIHHMEDDPFNRINDIARLLSPGGMLLIKDHDVQSSADADLVDFEHFVYLIADRTHKFDNIVDDFQNQLPMTYYSAREVIQYTKPMFDLVWLSTVSKLNRAYSAVLIRR